MVEVNLQLDPPADTDWLRAFADYWAEPSPETRDAIVQLLPDDWSSEGKSMLNLRLRIGRTLKEFLTEAKTA